MKKFLWEEMKYKTLTFFSFLETFCSGCTCVPHPETPSNLPPHSILLGCPSTPAVNALFHASNFDWPSISYMVIYMFQYYSLIRAVMPLMRALPCDLITPTKGPPPNTSH